LLDCSEFGNFVITLITELNGKRNVITLRKTARVILHEFHQNQSLSDPEKEKRNIIKTAANLIKLDIKSIESAKNEYPSVSDIESIEKNLEYLPESLKIFLSSMFSERECLVKLSSIGQAIVQATRPRSLIVPLQIGLAVQMHHTFGSRFLIDSLNSCGFSSSYSEVKKKYELNVAITHNTDITEALTSSHLQYIADNVDHNIRTIDGHGTFHGMVIVASVTPGFKRNSTVPRVNVDTEEL
jgi:superfamily II RNA helicase